MKSIRTIEYRALKATSKDVVKTLIIRICKKILNNKWEKTLDLEL